VAAAFGPAALLFMEKFSPSHVGKGGFAPVLRLAGAIGLTGGFLYFYQRSSRTSAGCTLQLWVEPD
jgi:NADH-ubiquinone oxidoreductase complex I subunit